MDSDIRRICKGVFNGDLEISSAAHRLKEYARGRQHRDASLTVSCTLFALWDMAEGEAMDERQARLATLARELCLNGTLDEDIWLSTTEWDLLEASHTIENVADDKRREVRFYTRVVYVQTRFNLASECPTGFARLTSTLHRLTVEPVGKLRADLCRLVGTSKIEPHRVLDILLEYLPTFSHPSHELLGLFDPRKVGHIMGRKFRSTEPIIEVTEVDRRQEKLPRMTRSGKGEDLRMAKENSQISRMEARTSRRYFSLCAVLEVGGYLDIAYVFSYLSPSLRETQEQTREFLNGIRSAAREQRFPNLNCPLPETRNRMTEKDKDLHSVYRDQKKFWYQPERIMETEASFSQTQHPFPLLAAAFLHTRQPGKALRMFRMIGDVFCTEITEGCLVLVEKVLNPFVDRLPVHSMEQFVEDVKTPYLPCLRQMAPSVFDWLSILGYRLHLRMDLFLKAALVMMHELKFFGHASNPGDGMRDYPSPKPHSVEFVIATVFLPSLLVMDLKQGLDASAWIEGLMKMCSYSARVQIFLYFEEIVTKNPILDRCSAMAETTARNLIKILVSAPDSKTFESNVLPIVDIIGRNAVCAPYQVTQMMIQKVQSDVMAAKDLSTSMLYFTPLAFSAFAHHFVIQVISTGGGRKHDDGHISQWYKNMLTLLGMAAHDYPDMLPLHFILQNILKEISNAEVIHVHILKELVHSMTGFQHCSEIGNSQFATLSGGPMLKSIGLVTSWQKDESGYNTPAVFLKKTLLLPPRNDRPSDERAITLGGYMFILLIKFLDFVPIRGDFAEVSSIMEMHSIISGTFLAFVEFLSVYCTAHEYSEMLPPLHFMLNDLKLPMHYVCHLYRPSISDLRVVQGGMKKEPTPTDNHKIQVLQSLLQKLQQFRNETGVEMNDGASHPQKRHLILSLERYGLADLERSAFQKYGFNHLRSFYDFVEDLSLNQTFIQMNIWDVMSPEFYTFFWSLKLNDITISDTEYRKHMSLFQEEMAQLEKDSRSEASLNLLEHKLTSLKMERDQQQTHVKFCRDFIRSRQEHFLSHVHIEKLPKFVDAFVQLCLYPRIRLGHEDALFAFEFIVIMTKMGVENFPTLFILDKVIKELFPSLICMTDNEAEGFANFMYEFLRQMERWRSSKQLFRKEFGSLPGAMEEPYTPGSTALVTHSNFLKVMAKWSNVIVRLLKECLQPQESEGRNGNETEKDSVKHRRIMRRPALLVLVRLIPIFPTLTGLAKHLRAALQYVIDNDKDEGMKTSAFTALSRLNAEMGSSRPGRWLALDAYNIQKDPSTTPQETVNEMSRMEIEDVMEIEKESTQELPSDLKPIEKALVKDEMDEELEEGLIMGSQEEGELEKTQSRRSKLEQEDSLRSSNRKRPLKSESGPETSLPRRVNSREDTKRKRETPSRSDSEKDSRKPRQTRREDSRRKP